MASALLTLVFLVVGTLAAIGTATTCAEMCRQGGNGTGYVIGTAPSCEGYCDSCRGDYCSVASSSLEDYGHYCLTGNKVCCCTRNEPEQVHIAWGSQDAAGNHNGMHVSWFHATEPADVKVQFGLSESNLDRKAQGHVKTYVQDFNGGFHAHAEMENLKPATKYYYRVGIETNNSWSKVFSFQSADTNPHAPFAVSIFGDMGFLGSKERPMSIEYDGLVKDWSADGSRRTLERLKNNGDIDFVWTIGDVSYADDSFGHSLFSFEYEDVYNGWMNWMQNVSATMPYMVSPGNHESECHSPTCVITPSRAKLLANFSAYNARWQMPSKSSKGVANMWYSFNYGNVHFVSMNSETDWPGAPEEKLGDGGFSWLPAGGFAPDGAYLRWLEADLAKAAEERANGGRQFIVVASHRPFHEISGNGVAEMFKKYDVDIYFAAHWHSYARSTPSPETGRPCPEIVVGGAGCDEMTYKAVDLGAEECRKGVGNSFPGTPTKISSFETCVLPFRDSPPPANITNATVYQTADMAIGVLRYVNATTLHWRLLRSEAASDEVLDELWITRKAYARPATTYVV